MYLFLQLIKDNNYCKGIGGGGGCEVSLILTGYLVIYRFPETS